MYMLLITIYSQNMLTYDFIFYQQQTRFTDLNLRI